MNSTSKLPNTSFWTTLDAGVRWNPPDSAGLQYPNHCCGLDLGLGLGFRLVLRLGLGVRQVYIYCGQRSWQLFHVESGLSLPESVESAESMDSSKESGPMCHMIIFCNFCFLESARLRRSRWGSVQSSLQLEIGVSAFDPIAQAIFELHAYLIVVFGDIPAISMIMGMKGHNAISPCCMCNIQGIRIPSSQITTHYVPLNHDHFSGANPGYQAHSLPLRNHKTFLNKQLKFKLLQPP